MHTVLLLFGAPPPILSAAPTGTPIRNAAPRDRCTVQVVEIPCPQPTTVDAWRSMCRAALAPNCSRDEFACTASFYSSAAPVAQRTSSPNLTSRNTTPTKDRSRTPPPRDLVADEHNFTNSKVARGEALERTQMKDKVHFCPRQSRPDPAPTRQMTSNNPKHGPKRAKFEKSFCKTERWNLPGGCTLGGKYGPAAQV